MSKYGKGLMLMYLKIPCIGSSVEMLQIQLYLNLPRCARNS